ncbi:MAG: ATP synthase F0 subunit B [Acidobacteriaceae bacterium]
MTFSRLSRLFLILTTLLCLFCGFGVSARALRQAPTHRQAESSAALQESGENVFRHSASVKFLARKLHVDTEIAARIFEYLNFGVLAAAVVFALSKYLPKTFRAQREDIQHRLVDARTATEQASERLTAIEQKLAHLDEEIAAISKQAEKDSLEDEARIKALIESERQRIVESVTRDVAAASGAAQRELKKFAAGLAVDRAAQRLALTEADDRTLVREFSESLAEHAQNGAGK